MTRMLGQRRKGAEVSSVRIRGICEAASSADVVVSFLFSILCALA
jgi:hypothetical protein